MTRGNPQISEVTKHSGQIDVSTDRFHRGKFELFQLKGPGHRSGMDAMLLGASLQKGAKGVVADLGAATGAAGFAAISQHDDLNVLLVEQRKDLCDLVGKSLQLESNRRFKDRVEVLCADVTLSGEKRSDAGLKENSVDHVIVNPPYNPPNMRPSPDSGRASAHVMGEGGLDSWMRTASAILKPGGSFSLIYRTERLGEVIACARGRFGDLRVLPVFSKEKESAKRIIVRGKQGSKAPLSIVPGIVMHGNDGTPSQQGVAVLNGQALLNFGE